MQLFVHQVYNLIRLDIDISYLYNMTIYQSHLKAYQKGYQSLRL
jgi:hypothetical protein